MRPGLSCGFVRRVDGGRAVVASWWQSHWPGGNFLADLVASIGRNDQAHHHPTVQGGGKFAVGRSLYRGEDDMSHGAAFDDRGDVVDEDRVGVAMILDRQCCDIGVFHRSPSATADRRSQSWAMKSAGLRLTLPTGSAAGAAAEPVGPTESRIVNYFALRATAGSRGRPAGPFSRGRGISAPRHWPRTPDTWGMRRSRRSRTSPPRNVE